MDRNRPSDHLGVNKLGKNIRKSPLHQPSFPNPPSMIAAGGIAGGAGAGKVPMQQQQQPPPPPQPQVYNISKNDFRSIVQQLTGSPSHDRSAGPPPPAPAPAAVQQRPQSLPKSPSSRLQRIRPPPLSPIARPPIPIQPPPNPAAPVFGRPPEESPISAYMRYLQNSIPETALHRPPPAPPAPPQHPPPSSGVLPTPAPPPAPWLVLPSPTAQFGLQSPSSFLNMMSPRSPYPLLSPGFAPYPSPLTPNFGFSAFAQSPGILGPGPFPPPSPGLFFPPSPGFLPILSPRWRE